jgi:hypothetical protein
LEYFAILAVATVVIGVLTLALYRLRRDAGLVIGCAVLYYWSLLGAWSIIIDKTGGFSGRNYQYLEYKLFPVSLDAAYRTTLGLYAGFIIVAQLTILMALSRQRERAIPRLILRHDPILAIGFVAALGSFLIMRDQLSIAWALNTSAYSYTRAQTNEWFTLHQVLNRVALIPPAIGVAMLAAGRSSRYFVNVVRRYTWPAYAVLLAGMGLFTFVLGNKNEVLMALLTGFLAYLAAVRRPHWGRVGLAALSGMWFLYTIDFFRGEPLSGLQYALSQRLEEATQVGRFATSSNEAFAAHFSMYGVLAKNTPPKFGFSLYSLICSAVPRVLWPDRPKDIYLYYSESVGAIQNQGYSLHHATGWYLNFGYAGVALGAIVLGLVWAGCLNAHQRIRPKSGLVFRLFATVAPWVFAAGLAPLVRAGPEGYKGLLIEGLLIPVGVLLFACRPGKARKEKLAWHRQRGWVFGGCAMREGAQ